MRSVRAGIALAVLFALFTLIPEPSASIRIVLGVLIVGCGIFALFAARDDLRERRLRVLRQSEREGREHVEQMGGHGETHTKLDAQAEQLVELTQTVRGQQVNAHARKLKNKAIALAAEIETWHREALRDRIDPPRLPPISAQGAVTSWGYLEGDGFASLFEADMSAEFARQFADRVAELRDSFAGLHMKYGEMETIFARASGRYSSRVIYVAVNGLRDLAERVGEE